MERKKGGEREKIGGKKVGGEKGWGRKWVGKGRK